MQFLEGGGPVMGVPNERWCFQTWYRDTVQGVATSNLTDAIAVRLE